MLTLFVSKNEPVDFFPQWENQASNTLLKVHTTAPPPPLPPPNGVKHTHAQCFSSQRSKSYNVWRRTWGEGGGIFVQFGLYFSAFLKKTQWHFWHKKSQHAKFQRTPSNLKNRNKLGTYFFPRKKVSTSPPSTEPFNWKSNLWLFYHYCSSAFCLLKRYFTFIHWVVINV